MDFAESAKGVNLEKLNSLLWDRTIPDESVNELAPFGQFLLGSLENRIDQRRNRAITVMGWSIAVLAFLLLGVEGGQLSKPAVAAGGATALVSIVCSLFAAWRGKHNWFGLRIWLWTKGADDFSNIENSSVMLNRLRVRQIAEIYSQRSQSNAHLSTVLWFGELALVASGFVLLCELFRQLCR